MQSFARWQLCCQDSSYVQARGDSYLLVPRRLNFFDTQINVMREGKLWFQTGADWARLASSGKSI